MVSVSSIWLGTEMFFITMIYWSHIIDGRENITWNDVLKTEELGEDGHWTWKHVFKKTRLSCLKFILKINFVYNCFLLTPSILQTHVSTLELIAYVLYTMCYMHRETWCFWLTSSLGIWYSMFVYGSCITQFICVGPCLWTVSAKSLIRCYKL